VEEEPMEAMVMDRRRKDPKRLMRDDTKDASSL